ncbi:MAG: hypothetical protein KGN77_08360 [Xanthomonadaceae bacterium]|nr:hypothetical protein [Xanthomonadaceae bacterium]MDE1964856.1 hypothetical protein [Xanthomonadaceae bacterium]
MDKTKLFRAVAFPLSMVGACVLMALSQHTGLARTLCFVAAGSFFVFAASITYAMVKRGAPDSKNG